MVNDGCTKVNKGQWRSTSDDADARWWDVHLQSTTSFTNSIAGRQRVRMAWDVGSCCFRNHMNFFVYFFITCIAVDVGVGVVQRIRQPTIYIIDRSYLAAILGLPHAKHTLVGGLHQKRGLSTNPGTSNTSYINGVLNIHSFILDSSGTYQDTRMVASFQLSWIDWTIGHEPSSVTLHSPTACIWDLNTTIDGHDFQNVVFSIFSILVIDVEWCSIILALVHDAKWFCFCSKYHGLVSFRIMVISMIHS